MARVAAAAVALAALGIYAATLAPAVPTGDSGELIAASYVGGVAHPPGYPVFTMLGWVATHTLPGSPAVIMNFLSALFQAATVGLIGLLTARLVVPGWPREYTAGRGTLAGVAAGLSLALSTAFWAYALVAEVFALNNLFAAALLLLAIEWYRDRTKVWALWTLGLLSGLGAAHQQTIVLLGPALAVLLVAGIREDASIGGSDKKRRQRGRLVKPSHFVGGAAMILVGLLTYLWLPIAAAKDPVMNFGDPETADRFFNVVSRGPYGSFSLIPGQARGSVVENLGLYGEYLLRAFTPVGILLAVAGAVYLWRARRTEAWALLTAFLFTGPSFVMFAAAPLDSEIVKGIVERFYILSSLIVAVAAGAGVYAAVQLIARRVTARAPVVSAAALTAVVLAAGALAVVRWPAVDQSDNRVAANYGHDLLADLEPNALLLTREDHNYTSLVYAQYVDGFRTDVVVLDAELLKLSSYVAEQRQRHPGVDIPFDAYDAGVNSFLDIIEANIDDRPVYIAGSLPDEAAEEVREIRAGLVRRLSSDPEADEYGIVLAEPSRVLDLRFPSDTFPEKTWESLMAKHYGNAAHSLGFALHETTPTDNDPLVEQMYEQAIALGAPPEAYKNLGLFYWEREGDPQRIIELWETYLAFEPDDPQVDAIRQAIDRLRSQ
jgi:hypothetical protein